MTSPPFDRETLERLSAFVAKVCEGFRPIQSVRPAGSGQSNPTYIITDEKGAELVLRQRPLGKLLASAHAIDREYRVMSALAGSSVAVPSMVTYCDDLSLIGADFYLMERVQGRAFIDPRLEELEQDQRKPIFQAMAETLAHIHNTDLAMTKLEGYGAPGAYFARGVARWSKQYRTAETQTHPQLEELMDWLTHNQPTSEGPHTLVHGDYRLDNLLIDVQTQAITAVVDWELSTTGHPLSDLGGILMQWALPPGGQGRGLMGVDRAALGLMSDEAFIAAYMAMRNGAVDLKDLPFATAFAFFRMAGILQGIVKRGLDGNAADPEAAAHMASYIPLLAAGGLMATQRSIC